MLRYHHRLGRYCRRSSMYALYFSLMHQPPFLLHNRAAHKQPQLSPCCTRVLLKRVMYVQVLYSTTAFFSSPMPTSLPTASKRGWHGNYLRTSRETTKTVTLRFPCLQKSCGPSFNVKKITVAVRSSPVQSSPVQSSPVQSSYGPVDMYVGKQGAVCFLRLRPAAHELPVISSTPGRHGSGSGQKEGGGDAVRPPRRPSPQARLAQRHGLGASLNKAARSFERKMVERWENASHGGIASPR